MLRGKTVIKLKLCAQGGKKIGFRIKIADCDSFILPCFKMSKYCEESVKSEPEQGPKLKRLKSVSYLGSEKKHDEDSYEEDKRDFTKEEDKQDFTEEKDKQDSTEEKDKQDFMEEEDKQDSTEEDDGWGTTDGKSEREDSEYSDYEDAWPMYDNDYSEPFMYQRRSDGCVFKNKAWLDKEAKIREYKELSRNLSVGIYQFQFVCFTYKQSLNFD